MATETPVRVFVGADRSQLLAVKVLEHSIKRHTDLPVEVTPMIDLPIRAPKDPRQGQRTGFSFSRFCIPALAGYRGRAIYMDADMLVFKDIRELWELPFDGGRINIQEELADSVVHSNKFGAPKKRRKQCAVMLLDCANLDWKIDTIIDGLDRGDYGYEQLMYELCLLPEELIRYNVPFRWNSLEHLDDTTCLIHYTDMSTQPWVSAWNKHAEPWFAEVRLMLENGSLTWAEVEEEIRLGYFRPSLLWELKKSVAGPLRPLASLAYTAWDKSQGYVAHKTANAAKKIRAQAGQTA